MGSITEFFLKRKVFFFFFFHFFLIKGQPLVNSYLFPWTIKTFTRESTLKGSVKFLLYSSQIFPLRGDPI